MKNKKTLILLVMVFVLLLAGAYVLYGKLADSVDREQLIVQEAENNEEETGKNETGENKVEGNETGEKSEQEEAAPQKISAPDFVAYDAEGNEVRLYDYIGKPIVLNFWASWCGPCKSEMPDFQEQYQELGEEIQFLMVNMTGGRETVETAAAFLEEEGYTFPVLYDTAGEVAVTYGVYSLPTTYFIDAEGYLVAQAQGMINKDALQQGIDMITEN